MEPKDIKQVADSAGISLTDWQAQAGARLMAGARLVLHDSGAAHKQARQAWDSSASTGGL